MRPAELRIEGSMTADKQQEGLVYNAAGEANLLHGFEESLAVVLEGHNELQLRASRLHRCWE